MSGRTNRLLDASSLMLMMKRLGDDLVPELGSFLTLDLTTYEVGNILWKEGFLSKSLTREEVANLATTTRQILTLVERVPMSPQDFGRVLELAEDEGLTFYDASYLQAAIDRGVVLVTEDARLKRAAKKHVAVKAAAEL